MSYRDTEEKLGDWAWTYRLLLTASCVSNESWHPGTWHTIRLSYPVNLSNLIIDLAGGCDYVGWIILLLLSFWSPSGHQQFICLHINLSALIRSGEIVEVFHPSWRTYLDKTVKHGYKLIGYLESGKWYRRGCVLWVLDIGTLVAVSIWPSRQPMCPAWTWWLSWVCIVETKNPGGRWGAWDDYTPLLADMWGSLLFTD